MTRHTLDSEAEADVAALAAALGMGKGVADLTTARRILESLDDYIVAWHSKDTNRKRETRAAVVRAALPASPAPLIDPERLSAAIDAHDHSIGWDRMCTGEDCARAILAALPVPLIDRQTEQRAVVAAAQLFLAAHDRVVGSDIVTRDDTFAMKNAADTLREVLREYERAKL